MARSADKAEQVAQLRDWCIFVIDYFNERQILDLRSAKAPILDAAARLDMRALRSGVRDLEELTNDIDASQRIELDTVLKAKFGIGLESIAKQKLRVDRIVARGQVKSETEWRLLRSRVDLLEGIRGDEAQAELSTIYRLLEAFEFGK